MKVLHRKRIVGGSLRDIQECFGCSQPMSKNSLTENSGLHLTKHHYHRTWSRCSKLDYRQADTEIRTTWKSVVPTKILQNEFLPLVKNAAVFS